MRITDWIKTEHGLVQFQLARIQELAWSQAPLAELLPAARRIVDAVEAHHRIEDRYVYPALRGALGVDCPPMLLVELQHEEIEQSAATIRSDGCTPTDVLLFVDLVRSHLRVEERLIAEVEDVVPDAKLASLYDEYVAQPPSP